MNGSNEDNDNPADFGGSIEVDGQKMNVDMAAFGWDKPIGWRVGETEIGENRPGDDTRVRLQKVLASAGVASRRACEELITSGRVRVNGEVVDSLGSRIEPGTDEVRVDGVIVQLDVSKRYFVLNKPRGVVSTMSDENGRPDLREFTDQFEERIFNVGRLDTDTSGLLILTNDGDLAHALAHPKFGVQKTYVAQVEGRVTAATIQKLKDGIELEDGPISVDAAKIVPGAPDFEVSLVELTLHSGRNRIVRRMLAEVGHPVIELVRRQFGPLHLGTLMVGEMRELSAAERGALLTAAQGEQVVSAPPREGARGKGGPRERKAVEVTGGRPGDGKGAKGMRGVASRGNPHARKPGQDPRGGSGDGGSGDSRQGRDGGRSGGNGPGGGGFSGRGGGFGGRGGSGGNGRNPGQDRRSGGGR